MSKMYGNYKVDDLANGSKSDHFRLYIDGQFEEPPPELLPPPLEQTRNKSSGCLIL